MRKKMKDWTECSIFRLSIALRMFLKIREREREIR